MTARNDLSEVVRIAEAIEAHGQKHGWSEQWMFNLNLVLDELITNIINYAYDDDQPHEIRVTLVERKESLVAVLEDDGIAFDPFENVEEPDFSMDLDDRPVGGLGVHLTRSLMDEVAYERRGNHNCVTLTQRTTGNPSSPEHA
ncbi:MAG: ATP-binding protein [bacterium]